MAREAVNGAFSLAGMGFEVLGVLLGNLIFGFIVSKYRVAPLESCSQNKTVFSINETEAYMERRKEAVSCVCCVRCVCCVCYFRMELAS